MGEPTVYLVEDYEPLRECLAFMLRHAGIQMEAFAGPDDLIGKLSDDQSGCLVLDLHLPTMDGLELQEKLQSSGCRMPFIIITGRGEVPDATKAMRRGAVDFLQKPFTRDVFLDRVWTALELDQANRGVREVRLATKRRLELLSVREVEVLDLIVAGRMTKQIASQLKISIKTVESHRSHIAKKMGVDSAIQLVQTVTQYRAA